MLDPLSAISLASSIVQLVDFGARLLKETDELRRRGISVNVSYVRTTTDDLKALCQDMKGQVNLPSSKASQFYRSEQALKELVDQSAVVASELLLCLESLTVGDDASTWESFRAAIRTIWDQEKVDATVKQLEMFRSQVSFRLLALLNEKSDFQISQQATNFEKLQRHSKDIVEVISINHSTLAQIVQSSDSHDGERHRESEKASQRRHEETMAAILTLRDGNTQTIARPQRKTDPESSATRTGLTRNSVTFAGGTNHGSGVRRPQLPKATLDDFDPILDKVLNCLYFHRISDRVEDVAEAHQQTFQWIFHDPKAKHIPWSNFIDWLERGEGCYWINGKAGSGKSTLMKYIQKQPKTREALLHWSGQNHLVTANYFFWNLGSTLQKSQIGLLRSLLFEIVSQYDYLIPSIFPGLCRSALANKELQASDLEPSFSELKQAFVRLIKQELIPLRICLFIDGIDEFEGDHMQVIDLLSEIAALPRIKIVLSSRPIPPCVESFSGFAKLRLQDLTYNDIKLYIHDNLDAHPNMKRLRVIEQTSAEALTEDICERASGVFLWVILVVRSLLQGLRNHDRISDLQRRLEELPTDLVKLYQHMLQTMSPLYLQQASQIFQIVVQSLTVQAERNLTLLQLSYAEEEDVMRSVAAPTYPLPEAAELLRYEATEGRLRSRCCGLVEVYDGAINERRPFPVRYPRVGFLHRTVAEFLAMEHIWQDIVKLTAKTSFDVNVALQSSCLHMVKACDIGKSAVDRLWEYTHDFLTYSRNAELTTEQPQTLFMDEFEKTMQAHFSTIPKYRVSGWQSSWTTWVANDPSFAALVTRFGVRMYLNEMLNRAPPDFFKSCGSSLLSITLEQFCIASQDPVEWRALQNISKKRACASERPIPAKVFANIASDLLKAGADPNIACSEYQYHQFQSPWSIALDHSLRMTRDRRTFLMHMHPEGASMMFLEMLPLLIECSSDPNAVLSDNTRSSDVRTHSIPHHSALVIIKTLLDIDAKAISKFRRLAPNAIQIIAQARDQIIPMLLERGAVERPWQGGYSSIHGPSQHEKEALHVASKPQAKPQKRHSRVSRLWKKIVE